eukprot:Skav226502  [mRNA]  locus=scaffold4305:123067:126922:- [translate_table: standard]
MEQLKLQGVETFVNWSTEQSECMQCIMVLFHGCNNQGHHWFQKPEEISFLDQVFSHQISVVAFTTPRHRGNFCWPSPDESSEFQDATDLISNALADLLKLKAESSGEQWMTSPLILVGASSGGNFAWKARFFRSDLFLQVAAFLSVVSPTSFVRNGELLEEPGPAFPPTASQTYVTRQGVVYMPKDKTFASEEAIATLLRSLRTAGVAAKAEILNRAWAQHEFGMDPEAFLLFSIFWNSNFGSLWVETFATCGISNTVPLCSAISCTSVWRLHELPQVLSLARVSTNPPPHAQHLLQTMRWSSCVNVQQCNIFCWRLVWIFWERELPHISILLRINVSANVCFGIFVFQNVQR